MTVFPVGEHCSYTMHCLRSYCLSSYIHVHVHMYDISTTVLGCNGHYSGGTKTSDVMEHSYSKQIILPVVCYRLGRCML